jgi:hypothetical protein
MAQSIKAELEGADATEAMPNAEDLAALFAELAAGDGEDAEEEAVTIDGDYALLPEAAATFTSLATEDSAANHLPIFAAMDAMTQLEGEPAATSATPAEIPQPTPTAAQTGSLVAPPAAPAPEATAADACAVVPCPTSPPAFQPGDRVRLPSGLTGVILAVEEGYMADVAVTGTRFCVLVPLSDLVPAPGAATAASPRSAAPAVPPPVLPAAPAAETAAPVPATGRTPTLWDFWNFQQQTDAATGVTAITVSPKHTGTGKKKAKGDAPEQLDIFTAFLTTEPTFTEPSKSN